MHASTSRIDAIAKLVPNGDPVLTHLSDDELHARTRRLVGSSNKLFAALLQHLAEVEARGIHRVRACASLYTYCIYELRMSEDAAARRSSAARLVKAFPALLDAIAAGELHLTGLLMIGPHLTPENHATVLARAKFRTKKELAKLVRELHPLPQVPDQVEPLGPQLPQTLRTPTWEAFVSSLEPPVRELPAGARPSDWANDTVVGDMTGAASGDMTGAASGDMTGAASGAYADEALTDAPARCELPPITAPQQYRMQFTATEVHVGLVERAKALFARASSDVSLGELHERAMQLLVEKLEKEKYAVTERPRRARSRAEQAERGEQGERGEQVEQVEQAEQAETEKASDASRHGSAAGAAGIAGPGARDEGAAPAREVCSGGGSTGGVRSRRRALQLYGRTRTALS